MIKVLLSEVLPMF